MWELTLIAGLTIAGAGVWMAMRKRPDAPAARDSDTSVPYYAGDGYTGGADGHCVDTTPAGCADVDCRDADGGSDSCADGGTDGGGTD
jgi:hypothetical protein